MSSNRNPSTTLSIQLPDSLYRDLEKLAQEEGVSLNQLVTLAVAEKVSALRTASYLEARAQRGNRDAFERVLAKVPDVEPEDQDRL